MIKSANIKFTLLDSINELFKNFSSQKFLDNVGDNFGLSHISYLGVNLPSSSEKFNFTTSYSDKWIKQYLENDYINLDPVVTDGLVSITPLDWSDVKNKTKK